MNQDLYKIANRRLAANHFCVDILGIPVEILSLRYIHYIDITTSPYYLPTKHRHTYYEAHIFVDGRQAYQVDEQVIEVRDGEVCCISPNVYHSIPKYTPVIEKYAICFTIGGANDDREAGWVTPLRESRFFTKKDTQDLKSVFDLILNEVCSANEGWQEAVKNLIVVLILKLARIPGPMNCIAEHLDIVSELELRMINAERFIRDNLVSNISCADVANFLHLSIRQLNRDVMKKHGMTMKRYIDTVRYERARELLKESTLTISQIGQEVGFKDRSDFHRFFKRMDGMSPGQYYSQDNAK